MRKSLSIIAIAFIFLFLSCGQSEPQVNQNIVSTAPSLSSDGAAKPNTASEPMFLSEGELVFMDESGKEISKIEIEIVDNEADRRQGLMYRKSMPEHRGMLFVFEEQQPQAFWMKNTLMPLDIIYVNDKNVVVSIQKNTTPLNEKSLPSTKPALYVVETNAGYTAKMGIKEGTKISFKKY